MRRGDDRLVTEALTIVGLGGSLARTSRSLAALRIGREGAVEAGRSTKLLNLPEPLPAMSYALVASHGRLFAGLPER